jgi:hypothetical protein
MRYNILKRCSKPGKPPGFLISTKGFFERGELMFTRRAFFAVMFLAILAWWLAIPPPVSAWERPPQWHTLRTLAGDTQIYGYTKDTSFGEIVVECDPDTGELTGHAYLNAYVGDEERLVGIEEETYVDWENPRTLNFLECQILAPNIPSSVDYDWEYHWEHLDEPMHYKPGPPIWPGNPSWALLAPDVPNNMLVVVKATNPNPYPVEATISGSVITYPSIYGNQFINDNAKIELASGETKYLKLPQAEMFLAEWPVPIDGILAYSTAGWDTTEYQILADDYPPSWVIDGSTTIDVPPYGRPNWNYEVMTYHPVYGHPPEEIPTPFNLGVKRYEPNWTRNFATLSMSQTSGAWDTWEAWYTPITGPAVTTKNNSNYRDFNMYYTYRGDTQIYVPRGGYIESRIVKDYWWPYNDGWNNILPFLKTDEFPVWGENYSFVPDTVTPPYVPPRDDGCGGTIPGYQPPDEIMNYGQLVSTPQTQFIIRRTWSSAPRIKNQVQINACTVDVVDRIDSDFSCNPVSTTKSHYTWDGSSFIRTVSTTPYAGETAGYGKVTMTFTNMIQGQNPSPLTTTFGVGGYSCDGYYFEQQPQTIHLPQTAQFDALLTDEVGVSLPKRVVTPPPVTDDCGNTYQPPDEYYDLLDGDITINISMPANQNTMILADQYTVEMPFESGININNLTSVLSRVSTPDDVIFTANFGVEYQGGGPAMIWYSYRHWRGYGENPWGDYYYDIMGFQSGGEKSASSYYSGSNPYTGHLSASPGQSVFAEWYPAYLDSYRRQTYYFRVLMDGTVYPYTYNPDY